MNRKQALEEIAKAVLQNRQDAYGPPENSFHTIAQFWNVYLDARMHDQDDGTKQVFPLLAHDTAAMMMLLKIARIAINPTHMDNWLDGSGYGVCGAEVSPQVGPQVGVNQCTPEPTMMEEKAVFAGLQKAKQQGRKIKASWLAHRLIDVTITQPYAPGVQDLLRKAILKAEELTDEELDIIEKHAK